MTLRASTSLDQSSKNKKVIPISSVQSFKTVAKDNVVLRCGDCQHFTGYPHPQYGEACKKRGMKPYATAPRCYTADISVFRTLEENAIATLSTLVASMTGSQTRVLMGLMKSASELDKFDLSFLQKVYIRLGDDYLSNYYGVYVLGLGLENRVLLVGSDYVRKQKNSVIAEVELRSIIKYKKFQRIRDALIREGKTFAPNHPPLRSVKLDDYEPPTIDTAQNILDHSASASKRKKTRMVIGEEG